MLPKGNANTERNKKYFWWKIMPGREEVTVVCHSCKRENMRTEHTH